MWSAFSRSPSGLWLPGSRGGGSRPPWHFPQTAAEVLTSIGNPVGWVAADVLGNYLCDQASGNLLDYLSLGPELAAVGAPNQDVALTGLPKGAKKGIDFIGPGSPVDDDWAFRAVGTPTFGSVPVGTVRSGLITFRIPTATVKAGGSIFGWHDEVEQYGWFLRYTTGNLWIRALTIAGYNAANVVAEFSDDSWHSAAPVFRDATSDALLFTDLGDDATPGTYGAALTGAAGTFALGRTCLWFAYAVAQVEIAQVIWLGKELTSAMRASYWTYLGF